MSLRMTLRTALVALVLPALLGSAALPAAAENIGNEGCTPGYWKNHTENWEEYAPTQKVNTVFTSTKTVFTSLGNQTLATALAGGGGTGTTGAAKILLRAATASVLNAAHEGVGYPLRRAGSNGIIARVDRALQSNNRSTMLNLASELDRLNNLGCPL